jgi:hypothetical protein
MSFSGSVIVPSCGIRRSCSKSSRSHLTTFAMKEFRTLSLTSIVIYLFDSSEKIKKILRLRAFPYFLAYPLKCQHTLVSRTYAIGNLEVRAVGVEPTRALQPCGFSCRLRLSPPGRGDQQRSRQVCGLDYPFTVPRKIRGLGAARLVSTPSRILVPGLARDCHERFRGFPEFGQFCIAGFPASTQVFLKSAAYAIPPRPRGLAVYRFVS